MRRSGRVRERSDESQFPKVTYVKCVNILHVSGIPRTDNARQTDGKQRPCLCGDVLADFDLNTFVGRVSQHFLQPINCVRVQIRLAAVFADLRRNTTHDEDRGPRSLLETERLREGWAIWHARRRVSIRILQSYLQVAR